MSKTQVFLRLPMVLFPLLFAGSLLLFSCKTPVKTSTEGNGKPEKKLTQEEQMQLTALFIDAVREKALGNEDKSMGLFAQCIKRLPTYAPAMYEMALVFDRRNQEEDALIMAENAVKNEPDNEWYQLLLGSIYIKKKEYAEASRVLKQLAERHPETPDYLMDLANVFLLAGKSGEAIKTYDDIEKRFGINEETSLQKEKLYLELGKINKAIDEVQKLAEAFPEEIRYLGILAELHLAAGNEMKGLACYEQMLRLAPGDPYVHLSLADYYRSKEMPDKSFEELKLAFANPAMDIDNKVRILLKYFEASERDEQLKVQAFTLCELTVTAHPNEPKAWSIAGDYHYRDRHFKEAGENFRRVIGLDSGKYVVWSQLMIINTELEDYARMEQESALAMNLFPDQAEMYLYNGFSNIRLKRYEAARNALRLGLSFSAERGLTVKLHINLAEANYKLKDYDAAFESYEKVLKLEPENIYVLNNYSFYLALQKRNLSRAEELARKLNTLVKDNATYEDTFAWVLFTAERYTEARSWLEKALEHGGMKSASVLEHYGDVLFKLNEPGPALEYWLKAREAGGQSETLNRKINDKQWYEQ